MPKVFRIQEGSQSFPMEQVLCKNEHTELQALLLNNFELLVGEQINPAEPRRWLMIKKEMPVPDPNSGNDRWAIDFLFSDQDAIPTFVECKRFNDTRTRREVVGQMLEYAANGHHYWTAEALKNTTQQTSIELKIDLEAEVLKLANDNILSTDEYFQKMENNLHEGQIRLIFFLEQAPFELKSIVEFLNRQMERAEVLIIEAKQYEDQNIRVTAPMLFGYTEQARQIKKIVSVSNSSAQRLPPPTFDELKNQAQGVEDLFVFAHSTLRNLLGAPARTRTGVSYSAYAGETKYSIINLYPAISGPEKGLAIGVYAERLIEHFSANKEEIEKEIGHPDPSIPINMTYRCGVYYFKDTKQIEKLGNLLNKWVPK